MTATACTSTATMATFLAELASCPDATPLGRAAYAQAGSLGLYRAGNPLQVDVQPDVLAVIAQVRTLGRHLLPGFAYWVHGDVFCWLYGSLQPVGIDISLFQKFVDGLRIGSIALSEATGGSSLQRISCSMAHTPRGLELNGTKRFVSLGSIADYALVSVRPPGSEARIGLALVDLNSEGVKRVPYVNRSAMRHLDICDIEFEQVTLSDEAVLSHDAGLLITQALTRERLYCSLIAAESYRQILGELIGYCRNRIVGGQRLSDIGAIRQQLGALQTRRRCIDALLEEQCAHFANGHRLRPEQVASCKIAATESLVELTTIAVRLRGATGVLGDGQHLLRLNDALAQTIYGGPTSTMHDLAASDAGEV